MPLLAVILIVVIVYLIVQSLPALANAKPIITVILLVLLLCWVLGVFGFGYGPQHRVWL